jgi:hypothetical protein
LRRVGGDAVYGVCPSLRAISLLKNRSRNLAWSKAWQADALPQAGELFPNLVINHRRWYPQKIHARCAIALLRQFHAGCGFGMD